MDCRHHQGTAEQGLSRAAPVCSYHRIDGSVVDIDGIDQSLQSLCVTTSDRHLPRCINIETIAAGSAACFVPHGEAWELQVALRQCTITRCISQLCAPAVPDLREAAILPTIGHKYAGTESSLSHAPYAALPKCLLPFLILLSHRAHPQSSRPKRVSS